MIRKNDWVCYEDGLDKETSDKIINLAENKLSKISDEEETYDGHIENHKDQKITDIVWTEEQWIYDAVWSYMVQANDDAGWKYNIHTAESLQIARYKKGMFYDWHPDGKGDHFGVYKNIANPKTHDRVRKLSMSVILNDDYEGGEFQFTHYSKEKLTVHTPELNKTGSIIVFPSDTEHRITPITKGIRYSLVAWFLGPPFK